MVLCFLPAWLQAQTMTDPQQAFREAAASGKPVLLVFQGSDWCLPCIRLEKKVLSEAAFLRFAQEHIIVLKADFPQKKKTDPELLQQYEALAEQYDPEGSFPKLILLDQAGKAIRTLRTDYLQPAGLIGDIEKELRPHADR